MKKKDNFDWIVIGVLAGAALIVVLLCIIVTALRPGTTTEPRYKVQSSHLTKLEVIKENGKCYKFMHAPYKVRVEIDCE